MEKKLVGRCLHMEDRAQTFHMTHTCYVCETVCDVHLRAIPSLSREMLTFSRINEHSHTAVDLLYTTPRSANTSKSISATALWSACQGCHSRPCHLYQCITLHITFSHDPLARNTYMYAQHKDCLTTTKDSQYTHTLVAVSPLLYWLYSFYDWSVGRSYTTDLRPTIEGSCITVRRLGSVAMEDE